MSNYSQITGQVKGAIIGSTIRISVNSTEVSSTIVQETNQYFICDWNTSDYRAGTYEIKISVAAENIPVTASINTS